MKKRNALYKLLKKIIVSFEYDILATKLAKKINRDF